MKQNIIKIIQKVNNYKLKEITKYKKVGNKMEYNINNAHTEINNVNKSRRDSIDNYRGPKKWKEDKLLKRKERALLEQEEKGYTGQLTELGRISYFIEYFDMIKLEEQNLPQVGPFENPSEKASFKYGYEMGKILVKSGFSEENYHKLLQDFEIKYQINNANHR